MPSKTPVKAYLGLTTGQVGGDAGSYFDQGGGDADKEAQARAGNRARQLNELFPLKRGYVWGADAREGMGLVVIIWPNSQTIPFETEDVFPNQWKRTGIIREEGYDLLPLNSTETLTEPFYATDKETGNTYRVPPGGQGVKPYQPWQLTSTPRGTAPVSFQEPISGEWVTPTELPGWTTQLDEAGRPMMVNKFTQATLKGYVPESPWGPPPKDVYEGSAQEARDKALAAIQAARDEAAVAAQKARDAQDALDQAARDVRLAKTQADRDAANERAQIARDALAAAIQAERDTKAAQEATLNRFQRAQEFAGTQAQAQQELTARTQAENARLNAQRVKDEEAAWLERQLLYANPRLPAAAYESIRSGRTPFVNQPFQQVDRGPEYQGSPWTTLTTPFQQMRAAGLNVQGAQQAYVDVPGVGRVFAGAPGYEQFAQRPGAQVQVPQLTPEQTRLLSLPSWAQWQTMSPDEKTYREAQLSGMGLPTQNVGQGGQAGSTGWLGGQAQATRDYWSNRSPYGLPGTDKFAVQQAQELNRQEAIARQKEREMTTTTNPFAPRPRVTRRF